MNISLGSYIPDKGVRRQRRVLVVEDNTDLRSLVEMKFANLGYEVVVAVNGKHALDVIRQRGLPDVAIVDIHMPEMNGIEFCEEIQQISDLPVIMLTAINDDETIVHAIEHYAEDYVVKPVNLKELVARVERVLRRLGNSSLAQSAEIQIDERLAANFTQQVAIVDGQRIPLTPIETKLLYILLANAGRTVSNEFLLSRVWPREEVFEDTLRVHIHRLRQKIASPDKRTDYITTVRGVGYQFNSVQQKELSAMAK
jgi:DNA-binding response OmpR family regulator